jgi:hypothetical protein
MGNVLQWILIAFLAIANVLAVLIFHLSSLYLENNYKKMEIAMEYCNHL